ncbi:MAG: PorV/PorQ family protein [Calditrichaeota bacterium]|nr:PorV/PorQ family protein [Calditrichota bacterium]
MKMRLSFSILLAVTVAATPLLAGNDNTGTSCANFLKIGVGARAAAMGGACVASVTDYSALYWNPAGIARIGGAHVGIAYTDWILDISHSFIGATYSLGPWGTLGASLNLLDFGEMERTTPSEPYGTGTYFGASDLALGVAYARELTDRFAVGVQFKVIRESISFSSASTIAVDAGTQFITGFHGMRLGMSITNFGGKMTMRGTDQMVKADIDDVIEGNPLKESRLETEAWPLPLTFRMGLSLDVLRSDFATVTVNTDFVDPRDVNPYATLGTEIAWNKMVFLRGGLVYAPDGFDEEKLSKEQELSLFYKVKIAAGGGLRFTVPGTRASFCLDYAYTDLGMLDYAHRFSFTISY